MATQRWPALWLLTDESRALDLVQAMRRGAAAGAGILVRHHRSSDAERRALVEEVKQLGAPLALARDVALARRAGALFVHNPAGEPGDLPFSLPVHDEAEAQVAAERGAALVFVSPVYPTRSHPGAAVLGEEKALELARIAGCFAVALGGMDAMRGAALIQRGFDGWAGIDCWRQNLKAVPI